MSSSYPPGNSGPNYPFQPPQSPFGPRNPFELPPAGTPSGFPASGSGPNPYGPSGPSTSPLAVLSLVGGIVSWLACCCSPVMIGSSLLSAVFGHVALWQINRSQGATGGKGLAWSGLILSYLALLASVSFLALGITANLMDKGHDEADGEEAAAADNPPKSASDALTKAEIKITTNSRGNAQGNSPEAIELARLFSEELKLMREVLFTKDKGGLSVSDGEFVTWCELGPGRCAFLVHVPSYRKFTDDAKDSLEELAWMAAQHSVSDSLMEGDKLAVGMKGVLFYGNVMVGKVVASGVDKNGVENESDEKKRLLPFFEPVAADDSSLENAPGGAPVTNENPSEDSPPDFPAPREPAPEAKTPSSAKGAEISPALAELP